MTAVGHLIAAAIITGAAAVFFAALARSGRGGD